MKDIEVTYFRNDSDLWATLEVSVDNQRAWASYDWEDENGVHSDTFEISGSNSYERAVKYLIELGFTR